MSGTGVSLNQLIAYYRGVLPSEWFAGVSTMQGLESVVERASRMSTDVPSIGDVERGVLSGDDRYVVAEDPSADEGGVDFSTFRRFGDYGSDWINDECGVVIENLKPGCSVLAAYAPEARLGGLLVLPRISNMKKERERHLAREGMDPDSPLFEIEGNKSVFHLESDIAAMIGAQQCLYCLEVYRFIEGFAKHGIGMGKIRAALLFIDGTQSSDKKYGTPPPHIPQFLGASVMLGVRVSKIGMIGASVLSDGGPLVFDPRVTGLMIGDEAVYDLTAGDEINMRKLLDTVVRFRRELQRMIGSRALRGRIWTYHVPMALAVSRGSPFSLGARFRAIRTAAGKIADNAALQSWLVKTYARWQGELPGSISRLFF